MNIKQVYDQVITDIGSIEMRNFINRINQCIRDLAMKHPLSAPIEETTISIPSGTDLPYTTDLPDDCAGIHKIFMVVGGRESQNRDFTASAGGVDFYRTGEYRVEYFKKTEVNTVNDEVDIPWQFLNAIVHYIVGKELVGIDDNAAVYNLNQYETKAQQAATSVRSQKTRNQKIKAPLWR